MTRKALEALYPDGEIPMRGQISVEAPGAEDEWFVGVFGDVITFVTGASPHTGFIGAEFGKTDDIFILIKKKVNWRLNNIFFYLSYLINELITKGLIQEIIKNNLSKNFFDFTKQIYVRDINSNNSWNNYELYVKK